MIIKVNFKRLNGLNVKKNVKRVSLAAATAAMCLNLGLSAEDTEAAEQAMRDIAQDKGAQQARAVIMDMENDHGNDPFDGPFIA